MEKNTEKKRYYILAAFLIALLPRLLFLFKVYPLSVTGDETFTLMPAALWAGLDWSGNAGLYRYYGYGFVAFLTPFFKMIHDPVLLYRVIVGFMILFQALIAPVSYHLMRRYFKMQDCLLTLLLSVICSYLVFLRAVYIYNEFIYDFVVWLVFWCMLELLKSLEMKKKKVFLTALLAVLIAYAMTLHSRAVTLWIALFITVVFFFFVYGKWIVSVPVFAVLGIVGYIISNQGIDRIIEMFTGAPGTEVGNAHVSFSVASIFYSAKSGMAWLYIVLGQISTMVIVTGGTAMIAAVVGCKFLWKALLKKEEIVKCRKENQNYFAVFAFGLSASAITIVGQAFSWLPGVIDTLETSTATDGMRAVTYLRYYGIYFVPVLMAGFLMLYQNKKLLKETLRPAVFFAAGLLGFWLIFIVPYISDFVGTSWESNPFSFTRGWEDPIRIRTYLPAVFFAVVLLLIFSFLIKKNRFEKSMLLLSVLLLYTYGFNCVYHEGARGEINYSYVEKSRDKMQKIEKQVKEPFELYVEDLYIPVTGQSLVSECQFVFLDKKIIPGIPVNAEGNVIFMTSSPERKEELLKNGFLCAKLDDNEYWYIKGDILQEMAATE